MNKVLWISYLFFNSNASFISVCSCVNCNKSTLYIEKWGRNIIDIIISTKDILLVKTLQFTENRFQNELPGVLCCWMVPAPYRDKMESLESCFFATSSDFVVGSVNRSRSPDVTVDRVAAAGTEDVPWDKHQNMLANSAY